MLASELGGISTVPWSLSITGHVHEEDGLARQIESEVLEATRRYIKEIRAIGGSGVASASFIGYYVGPVALKGATTIGEPQGTEGRGN